MRLSLLAALVPLFSSLIHVALAAASDISPPAPLQADIGPWPTPTPGATTASPPSLTPPLQSNWGPFVPRPLQEVASTAEEAKAGDGGVVMMVKESTTNQQTSVGNITTHCLTLMSDPTQTFCRTLLDGEALGGDVSPPIAMPSAGAQPSSESSSPLLVPSPSLISPTTVTLAHTTISTADISQAAATAPLALVDTADSAASASSSESSSSRVETITISATSTSFFAPSASPTTSPFPAALAGAIAGETSNISDDYPGQKLSVLPIGLGVFGGLVGIALCIVGYMLYQRRLYRGQFVRRKAEEEAALASKGAEMGGRYGGA